MKLVRSGVQILLAAASLPLLLAASPQEPLGSDREIAWSHAPYEVGDCAICHESSDPESPGDIIDSVNELCYGCHEDIQVMMNEWETLHFVAEDSCSNCHNPHNAGYRNLLIEEATSLCVSCHDDIGSLATESEVTHDAVTDGSACMGCHNPHASHVEKLLLQLPFDLCDSCHNTDDLLDDRGRPLTNISKLISENPELHGPVAAKDCSACHLPHGGDNFRLLVNEYPEKFYAPYDPENYALCFSCHDSQMAADPMSTTLTEFRDGDRNLHYLHVNKTPSGRTCRACHEVHAAEQAHIIRDGVPYGSRGWVLKINYEKLPNGGQCEKTCHATRAYDRTKTVVDAGQ